MAVRRYADHEPEEESYFVSMTDVVIGLLFIFIIMLMFFAMRFQEATKQRDETTQKQNMLIEDLTDSENARRQVLQDVDAFFRSRGMSITIVKDEGVLRLSEDILFAKSNWELNGRGGTAAKTLSVLADALDHVLPCYTVGSRAQTEGCPKTKAKIEAIFIEGHADSDVYNTHRRAPTARPQIAPPRGGLLTIFQKDAPPPLPATPAVSHTAPPKDNLDLSTLRATSTFRELMSVRPELGLYLNPSKKPILSVSGYGDYRPLEHLPNETDEEYKKRNRRIDLRILMATPRSEDARRLQHDLRLESEP